MLNIIPPVILQQVFVSNSYALYNWNFGLYGCNVKKDIFVYREATLLHNKY